jgi:FkbM family methyltransferase
MDVGAGREPWIVAGAVAARNTGIADVRLTAVEADPSRFRLLRRHFADNGFDPDAHSLIQAVVGPEDGPGYWRAVAEPASASGASVTPDGDVNDDVTHGGGAPGDVEVNTIAFRDLLQRERQWDLVHINIRGREAEVCESCRDILSERVRWLIVATHSRVLDGRVIELMWSLGWHLENERPPQFVYSQSASSLVRMNTVDGTQVWSNPNRNGPREDAD